MEEKKFKTFGELTNDDVIYWVDKEKKTITEVTAIKVKKEENGQVLVSGQALDMENTDVNFTGKADDSHSWNNSFTDAIFVNLADADKFINGGIETLENLVEALASVPYDIEGQLKAAGVGYNPYLLSGSNLNHLILSCQSVLNQYQSMKDETYTELVKEQNETKEKAFNAVLGKVKKHFDSIRMDDGYSIYLEVYVDGHSETIKAHHVFIDKYDSLLKAEGTLLGCDSEEKKGVVKKDTDRLLEAYREIVEQEIREQTN